MPKIKLRHLILTLLALLTIIKFGILGFCAFVIAIAIFYRIVRPIFSFIWKGLTYTGTIRTNPLVNNRLMNFDLAKLLNK